MRRRTYLARVGTAVAVTGGGLAGCGGDGGGTPTELGENAVGMYTSGANYFAPIGLHVEPGETVTWVNVSGQHSATAYAEGNSIATETRIPEGADAWNSGTLTSSGETFDHAFDVEGTYDYFCIPHKSLGMVGRIVVGEPGGPAEGSMPPDGSVPSSDAIVEQGSISRAEFVG